MNSRGAEVFKLTGSGNDFLFVDGRATDLEFWTPARIRAACARRIGAGADGLVVLSPGAGADRVRFHFFNSDGSRGAMCGNAALCATRLAASIGMASGTGMVLETDAGEVHTRCLDEADRAEILLPPVFELRAPAIDPGSGEQGIAFAKVGVDHLVVLVDDLNGLPMDERGPALRSHPALGPDGANVNFVGYTPDGWAMRTWERGVEGETLACGTGAVASAIVLGQAGRAELPWTVRTRSGALLTVSGRLTPGGPAILAEPRLAGEGRLVYHATLERLAP